MTWPQPNGQKGGGGMPRRLKASLIIGCLFAGEPIWGNAIAAAEPWEVGIAVSHCGEPVAPFLTTGGRRRA
jgi:hypothetical protein